MFYTNLSILYLFKHTTFGHLRDHQLGRVYRQELTTSNYAGESLQNVTTSFCDTITHIQTILVSFLGNVSV